MIRDERSWCNYSAMRVWESFVHIMNFATTTLITRLFLLSDASGKTTILYRLQNESDEAVQTIPTIGFNVETLQYKNIKVSWLTFSRARMGGLSLFYFSRLTRRFIPPLLCCVQFAFQTTMHMHLSLSSFGLS